MSNRVVSRLRQLADSALSTLRARAAADRELKQAAQQRMIDTGGDAMGDEGDHITVTDFNASAAARGGNTLTVAAEQVKGLELAVLDVALQRCLLSSHVAGRLSPSLLQTVDSVFRTFVKVWKLNEEARKQLELEKLVRHQTLLVLSYAAWINSRGFFQLTSAYRYRGIVWLIVMFPL